MLTTQSYYIAWLIYLAAALGLLWCARGWLLGRLPARFATPALASLAALLLAPALAGADAETFAPAIVVAAFELSSNGLAAARIALWPMALALLPALAIGVWLGARRRPRRGKRAA